MQTASFVGAIRDKSARRRSTCRGSCTVKSHEIELCDPCCRHCRVCYEQAGMDLQPRFKSVAQVPECEVEDFRLQAPKKQQLLCLGSQGRHRHREAPPRRADSMQDTWPMIHNLRLGARACGERRQTRLLFELGFSRCLLVLLLTHQFDMQLARQEAPAHATPAERSSCASLCMPPFLHLRGIAGTLGVGAHCPFPGITSGITVVALGLQALLQILKESWRTDNRGTDMKRGVSRRLYCSFRRTGASREMVESGPEFGPELEEVRRTRTHTGHACTRCNVL